MERTVHALLALLLVDYRCCRFTQSFQISQLSRHRAPTKISLIHPYDCGCKLDDIENSRNACTKTTKCDTPISRRNLFTCSALSALSTAVALTSSVPVLAQEETEQVVFKTPSGLKYLELEAGIGPTPAYGQLVSIQYDAYVKVAASKDNPNPKPELFEKQQVYLIKHGNARTIAGLDEGIHTMRVGGKRRLLIPPKLGYVDIGLGPVPAYPFERYKLNKLLEQMVAVSGGTLIFEVRLLSAIDDEADQGYYQDDSLTPEEFQQLRENLQEKAKLGQASQLPT